jgi:hypothetical protein
MRINILSLLLFSFCAAKGQGVTKADLLFLVKADSIEIHRYFKNYPNLYLYRYGLCDVTKICYDYRSREDSLYGLNIGRYPNLVVIDYPSKLDMRKLRRELNSSSDLTRKDTVYIDRADVNGYFKTTSIHFFNKEYHFQLSYINYHSRWKRIKHSRQKPYREIFLYDIKAWNACYNK